MQSTYYLAYLTANDSPTFHVDYFNFLQMARFDPGVDCIQVYVAVSLAKPWTALNEQVIRAIMNVTNVCHWLNVKAVILKNNTGRDFSSAKICLELISETASDQDYIMVRSRSSRGPMHTAWYKQYIDQFHKFENTGLVGSTINLNDHKKRGNTLNVAHIQSYIYLSQWKYLKYLLPDFPATNVTSHLDAILHGEIELSQRIMSKGWRISSLQKPEMAIDASNQNDNVHSSSDKIVDLEALPFIHKRRVKNKNSRAKDALRYSTILFYRLKKKGDWRFHLAP